MISAVAQTLAQILVNGTSLQGTEQIDFSLPHREPGETGLTVYCYCIQEHPVDSPAWNQPVTQRQIEVSFLISASDYTVLGEQQLLSEALMSLLCQNWLQGDLLPAELGCERLPFVISPIPGLDLTALWRSLELPLRPALYVTVTVPIAMPIQASPQPSNLAV